MYKKKAKDFCSFFRLIFLFIFVVSDYELSVAYGADINVLFSYSGADHTRRNDNVRLIVWDGEIRINSLNIQYSQFGNACVCVSFFATDPEYEITLY